MNKHIIVVFMLLSLTGCTTNKMYGNFVKNPVEIDQRKIAEDTVKKIVELYPPAKTHFELKQTTSDMFGTALVHYLRDQGYAITELVIRDKSETRHQKITQRHAMRFNRRRVNSVTSHPATPDTPPKPTVQTTGLPLHYIFDQLMDTQLYRVTILIGDQSVTRVYHQQNDHIVPAGHWIRKE